MVTLRSPEQTNFSYLFNWHGLYLSISLTIRIYTKLLILLIFISNLAISVIFRMDSSVKSNRYSAYSFIVYYDKSRNF